MRVEALPRGDPNDNETLRKFAGAVLAAEPNAIAVRYRFSNPAKPSCGPSSRPASAP